MLLASVLRKEFALGCLLAFSTAYAEVPVVDATETNGVAATAAPNVSVSDNVSSLSVEQRLGKLEHQMDNAAQMDLSTQVSKLQQQLQKMQGQLEEQSHQVSQLMDQMHLQYQDLDQRLTQGGIKSTPTPPIKKDVNAPKQVQIPALLPIQSPPPATTNIVLQEQKAYQDAYTLLRGKDYVRATTALQNFLSQYPQSNYVGNVHYWLGEIYLLQGQPDPAIGEFNTVVEHFPTNPKVPDAMLKIGFSYYDKAEWVKAKTQLLKVQSQFPNTATAQLATARLQEMKQQGK